MKDVEQISPISRNTELPFFPNLTWNLLEEDKGKSKLPTFIWIQAFFDAQAITEVPTLVIWDGHSYHADQTPIVNEIAFAYSGERINIKGKMILESGLNVRGQAVTSSPIGAVTSTDILKVIAFGGMY